MGFSPVVRLGGRGVDIHAPIACVYCDLGIGLGSAIVQRLAWNTAMSVMSSFFGCISTLAHVIKLIEEAATDTYSSTDILLN